MKPKKIKNLSQIKTVEDLKLLKLERKYQLELKRMEFHFHVLQLSNMMNLENIKNEIVSKGKSLLFGVISDFAPSFLVKMFSR